MKLWMRCYLYSFVLLFASLLIFSVISSFLYTFSFISTEIYRLLNTIFPYLAFGASGICFGFFVEKKVLLQALLMCFILTLIAFMLQENTTWLHLCLHSILFLAGALFIPCLLKR